MADPSAGGEMVTREYRKGNWTLTETLVLIEAKKMDEERRVRRSTTGLSPEKQPESRNRPAELRWKWIEEYCYRKGCMRNQNQCNDKWDNLMRDYKKIREYERLRVESSSDTCSSSPALYLEMEKSERKERNLPSNMLPLIYDALAELVEKKSFPSSSSSAIAAGNGDGGQILRMCQQSLGFVAPMRAQPMHQIPATIALSLPPPPPPLQSVVLSLPPPPPQVPPSCTFHAEPIEPTRASNSSSDSDKSEYSDTSPAKRRRKTPGETTVGGEREAEEVAVGVALSRSASMIAQVIRENEERQERRHKKVMRLQEMRLKIEESKAEVNRQCMNGLVDAINQLATSILALASSSSTSSHNNQNHQGGPL